MLASITPLGERSRGRKWSRTVTAYVVGAVAGGAALGVVAGAVAALAGVLDVRVRWAVIAAAVVITVIAEWRWRLPTVRRQVDVRWLDAYRGWVVGLGYGAQLGAAVVTIVPTAATWVMLWLGVASGSFAVAVVTGVVFGAVRAAPVLATWQVTDVATLHQWHRRLAEWGRPADRFTRTTTWMCAAGVVALAVGAAR